MEEQRKQKLGGAVILDKEISKHLVLGEKNIKIQVDKPFNELAVDFLVDFLEDFWVIVMI